MLYEFLGVVLLSAAAIVIFMIVASGDFATFKQKMSQRLDREHYRAYVQSVHRNDIVSRKDLDLQLDMLQFQLERKQRNIEMTKGSVQIAAQSLHKLSNTSKDVIQYYQQLKEDISHTECDCKALQMQIEEFRRRRELLAASQGRLAKYELGNDVLQKVSAQMDKISRAANAAKREEGIIDFTFGDFQHGEIETLND